MATTPRGDDPILRRSIVSTLARRIVQQRTGAGTTTRPVPLRRRPSLTAIAVPPRQGQQVRTR